jgi:hypothetical protein
MQALAQDAGGEQQWLTARHIRLLNFSENYLPKELLTGKTLVLIALDPEPDGAVEREWKRLAEEAHPVFRTLGIDPVLYLYWPEVFAGPDYTRAIAGEMVTRELSCVAILTGRRAGGLMTYGLSIASFSGNEQIVKPGAEAWYYEAPTLESIYRALARTIGQLNLVRGNMLIMESPEYYRSNALIRGRRTEGFITDLRIDRLAVPRFAEVAVPENLSAPGEGARLAARLREWNARCGQLNADLESLFSSYSWAYALVDYDFNETNMRNKGFQYVLVPLRGEPRYLRRLLGYRDSQPGAELRSHYLDESGALKYTDLAADRPVYKFYIKHIHTGDVYLGEQWDAADTWQEALHRHLSHVVKKLGERK